MNVLRRLCSRLLWSLLLAVPAAGQVTLEGFTCVGGTCTPDTPLRCDSPPQLTISGGRVTVPAGGGCFDVDTEGEDTTDTLTDITCTAGDAFTLKAESDARTVVVDAGSLAVYGATDQSLDQDGDYSFWTCPVANAPVMWGFYDESGAVTALSVKLPSPGQGVFDMVEGAALTAPPTAGEHRLGFVTSESRLCSFENGGSQQCYALTTETSGAATGYIRTTFSSASSVTITHNLGVAEVPYVCVTSAGLQIDGHLTSVTANAFTVNWPGQSLTGACVATLGLDPPYTGTFSSVTSLAVAGATHGKGCDVVLTVWDDANPDVALGVPWSVADTTCNVAADFGGSSLSGRYMIQ